MGNKEENDNINNRPKSKKLKMSTSISTVVTKFLNEYASNTPNKLKIVNAYLGYVFFTGGIQVVYCCLVGTFPFNFSVWIYFLRWEFHSWRLFEVASQSSK